MKELTIEYCKGSNEGEAIYISNGIHGHRLLGGKCWGNIRTIKSFTVNVDQLIKELKEFKKFCEKLK